MELGFELSEPDNYTLEEQLIIAKEYLLTAYKEKNKGAIEYYEEKVAVLEEEIQKAANTDNNSFLDKRKNSLN